MKLMKRDKLSILAGIGIIILILTFTSCIAYGFI